jgi:hypothetical protein
MKLAAAATDPILKQRLSETAQGWNRLAIDMAISGTSTTALGCRMSQSRLVTRLVRPGDTSLGWKMRCRAALEHHFIAPVSRRASCYDPKTRLVRPVIA